MYKLNFTAILAVILWTGVARAAEPIDIGSRRELFVDQALIEQPGNGAELQLHHPVQFFPRGREGCA